MIIIFLIIINVILDYKLYIDNFTQAESIVEIETLRFKFLTIK